MPRLPRNDIKVVVRPRDGLNIRNTCRASLDEAIRHEAGVSSDEIVTICPKPMQNILVISTPDEKTATKIVKIKKLTINEKKYETNANVSAPLEMAKGIIRNIPLKYTQVQLMYALANARNPSLAYAKRLGSTTTVILLYEGNRVPMCAYFNSIMMRVSLYRKQIDFCKECGRLGHRPDVCPRPDDKLCPACGAKNPAEDHECTAKCKLCGEAHPTADRTCRAKLKTPYMVKQRRWTARRNEEELQRVAGSHDSDTCGSSNAQPPPASTSRSRSTSRSQPGARCRSSSRSRSRSRARAERGSRSASEGKKPEAMGKKQEEQKTPDKTQSSPPSNAVAAVSAASTKTMEEEKVEMVEEVAQQPGAKRKIPVTKSKEQDGSEQEVKRPRPSTKKTDVLEDMINKLSDKMEKMFEMLVVRISDSEAERKAQALMHDKRLEELEKRIS
ncbi:hypothetical protein HPB52_010361 [Rhipicephalus sanguineus]|uniref:CCHC-type domain-containing protein n=1 Tax=Rhipicephalus sanguineus TaxID=34632 RepID=A0A9D4PRJ4_RHISA|nr:hypothetical protein HPB52_010361 [Rhipicephalus sanguineus]